MNKVPETNYNMERIAGNKKLDNRTQLCSTDTEKVLESDTFT